MLKPIALSATHMECQNLRDTVPVLTDLWLSKSSRRIRGGET
jgi:hypothetical protein